jgi:hypothetical protein
MKTDWKYARIRDGGIEFFDRLGDEESNRGIIQIDAVEFLRVIELDKLVTRLIYVEGNKIEYDFIFDPTYDDLPKYAGPFSYTWFKKRPYLRMGWHELKERTPCTIEIYNVLAITETADVLRARYA